MSVVIRSLCARGPRARSVTKLRVDPSLRASLIVLFLCCSPGVNVRAQSGTPFVGVNAGAPISGGNILFTNAVAADIAGAGCQAVRINFRIDGNTTWTATHLARYDTIIQNARNHNLEVLGIIAYEAVHGSQSEWNTNYNTTGISPYTWKFVDNAWLLINRYRNDIKLFEIWNEPDCWSVPPAGNPLNPGCYYIWPKNYANLLAEVYKKCINQGGPNFFSTNGISLSTGGLFAHDIGGSFSTSRGYFTDVYNETAVWDALEAVTGRRYPWHLFGYHFYLNQGSAVSTSELNAYFSDIRAMKAIYNDDSPILVTEFGWIDEGVGLQGQANNLTASYNWMRSQGDIRTAYWYQWNDGDPNGSWGLVFNIGNPKPSYHAFADQCSIASPPAASFAATPVSGPSPLTVQFTDHSTGQIDSWTWSFGDSSGSSQRHPTHTYIGEGRYTVSLTVSGPSGSDTSTKPLYIDVGPPVSTGDFNNDGHVDQLDVTIFLGCLTGPNVTEIPPGCDDGSSHNKADLDHDGDADSDDFGIIQRCMTGPSEPLDPDCAE